MGDPLFKVGYEPSRFIEAVCDLRTDVFEGLLDSPLYRRPLQIFGKTTLLDELPFKGLTGDVNSGTLYSKTPVR